MILAPFKSIHPRPLQLKSWANIQIGEAVDMGEFAFGLQHYPIPFSDIVATVEDSDLLPPKSTHIKPKPLHGMLIFDFLSK